MTYTQSCLLIDDDHDDQLVFTVAIKEINKTIRIDTADDGFDALKRLEEDPDFRPDLIFLDLNLPGMHGMECLMKIKNNPKTANIPVIIYSTSTRSEDIVRTRDLGATAFITKPSHLLELIKNLKVFFTH